MTEGGSFISFGVEGVPYSQVRVEITNGAVPGADDSDAIAYAVSLARLLADEYAKAFPETRYEGRSAPQGGEVPYGEAPPPDDEYAPSEPLRVGVDENGEARFEGGRVDPAKELWACPDCGRRASPSIEKYQQWDRGDDGREYAAKWRCVNDQCPTRSLWRSKLVPFSGGR